MSTAPDEDIERALAEMSAEYAAGLDARVARLRDAMTSARAAAVEGLETARREAHRLRGTAGSFGFDAISDVAARLEIALDAFAAGAGDFAACDEAFAELELVSAAARPPPPGSDRA